MTWREKSYTSENGLHRLIKEFNTILETKYKKIELRDHLGVRTCFILENGVVIHVFAMIGSNFDDLAIEYADNIDRMTVYDTEDGDLFPPDMFDSKEALFQEMLAEIER